MEIFAPQLNLGYLLKDVASRAAAFAPHAVRPEFCRLAADELAGSDFKRQVKNERVKLDYGSLLVKSPSADLPAITRLGEELAWRVRLERSRLPWYPNEIEVHRYEQANGEFLGTHRDFSRDRYLIAVITLAGYGGFEVVSDQDATSTLARWETGPGSLTLMWAPGFDDREDRRPYHRALTPICGQRLCAVYRMVTCPSE